VHQGKKNGGKTYHKRVDVRADVPDHLPYVIFASVLFNMADPKYGVLVETATRMTQGSAAMMTKSCKYMTD